MKILAGLLAATLLATPAFAQPGSTPTPPAAGSDQGKPPADNTPPGDDSAAAAKPADSGAAATPEPEEAPEGTTPVKPADTPSR